MTSQNLTVTREAARRFLAARHFLAPPRSLLGGPDAVMEVLRRLGSIQFDPIAVAGRNHDLVLHARVAGYDPVWCDELLYQRRELFETQNKALSLVPTAELPWYRVSWIQGRESPRMFNAATQPVDLGENRELHKITYRCSGQTYFAYGRILTTGQPWLILTGHGSSPNLKWQAIGTAYQ
jgi:hypothetical protein